MDEAARKPKEEAEKNKDNDKEHNKGTAHDKGKQPSSHLLFVC